MAQKRKSEVDADFPRKSVSNNTEYSPLYLSTNNESVITMDRRILFDQAPNSWLVKVINGRVEGDTSGDTQDHPLQLPLPTWFVQSIADWAQPLSTEKIYFAYNDEAVMRVLNAIGWDANDHQDLPIEITPRMGRKHGVSELATYLSSMMRVCDFEKAGSVTNEFTLKQVNAYIVHGSGEPAACASTTTRMTQKSFDAFMSIFTDNNPNMTPRVLVRQNLMQIVRMEQNLFGKGHVIYVDLYGV